MKKLVCKLLTFQLYKEAFAKSNLSNNISSFTECLMMFNVKFFFTRNSTSIDSTAWWRRPDLGLRPTRRNLHRISRGLATQWSLDQWEMVFLTFFDVWVGKSPPQMVSSLVDHGQDVWITTVKCLPKVAPI